MHRDNPNIDSKNWVKLYHGVCRSSQIESKLKNVIYKSYINYNKLLL